MFPPLLVFMFSPDWIVVVEISPAPSGGGSGENTIGYHRHYLPRKKGTHSLPERSETATEFINELKEKIMETGVVKNKHERYSAKTNKRYQVSEKQAARIAYSIAKEKGLKVGKYRGPNK